MTPTTAERQQQLRRQLAEELGAARDRTLSLVAELDDEVLHTQHVDFMSPVVWDVGHVGNFEELWLVRQLTGRPADDPDLDQLYNPFENPRWTRGDLPILPRDRALPYLAEVRDEVLAVLRGVDLADPDRPLTRDGYVHRMLVSHESQHQETILQALGMREDLAPLRFVTPRPRPARPVDDEERIRIPGGEVPIGTDELTWTYDNERPAHHRTVDTFELERFPVTNRRYAAFIADGGYRRDDLWDERGRAWLAEHGHDRPQGWLSDGRGGWELRRLGHRMALDPAEPVQHISWFEADAFCRWAGGRLPTEHEWEKAARYDPATGQVRRYPWGDQPVTTDRANVGLRHAAPTPVGSYPRGASAYGVEQMAGDVYEWTSSGFDPYPGFVAFPYAEYSEVFFGGDWKVLRGSSWAIGDPMARCTYRNWDHPYRRQLMAGVRVAYDVRD